MGNYKTIWAHMREDEMEQIRYVIRQFGFRSVYEFVSSSVRLMLRAMSYVDRSRGSIEGEIAEEFAGLYEHEEVELGAKPKWQGGELLALLLSRGEVDTQTFHEPNANRAYADEFVRRHYTSLYRKYSIRTPKRLESNGYTPLDIFSDTIASLFECREVFSTYEDFEAYAMRKFDKRG